MAIRRFLATVASVVVLGLASSNAAHAWSPCSMHPRYGSLLTWIRVDWEGRCGDRSFGNINFGGHTAGGPLECWYQVFDLQSRPLGARVNLAGSQCQRFYALPHNAGRVQSELRAYGFNETVGADTFLCDRRSCIDGEDCTTDVCLENGSCRANCKTGQKCPQGGGDCGGCAEDPANGKPCRCY